MLVSIQNICTSFTWRALLSMQPSNQCNVMCSSLPPVGNVLPCFLSHDRACLFV